MIENGEKTSYDAFVLQHFSWPPRVPPPAVPALILSGRTCPFQGGKWARFLKNACVAHPSSPNLESRACECLSHLISSDRQHWETSNLHESQKHTGLQGLCLCSIKSPLQVWTLTFPHGGWFSVLKADWRTVSWSCVDVRSLASEYGSWFSHHWF